MWAVFASILALFFGWKYPYVFVVVIPFQLYCIYRLAKALGMHIVAIVFLMLAMFIPFVSLICLFVLNGKATSTLQLAGIKVGLMGAKISDLPSVEN